MPVSQDHDRPGMRTLATNRRHRPCPARFPWHRFRRLWLEGDQERPDEYGYQKRMLQEDASPYCEFLEGPTLEAVYRGPETIPKATNPEFQQRGRSEDE